MAQLSRGGIRQEQGAAPSSVSMAVLWIEGCGLLLAMPLFGVVPEARTVFVLPVILPALLFAGSLITAACVLPSVALGHWLEKRWGSGRRWWWVAAATMLVALSAVGLSLLVVALYGQGAALGSWREAFGWLGYVAVLFCASLPATLAAHMTVLRADAGRPIRPVGQILGYGSLALLTESVGVLVVWTAFG
ncbi:hypothetical protein [Streptomyces altiplanensis]